jgi:prepilin peptidase CpaA
VFAITAVAAFTDLRTKKLPNWLTVPSFVVGLLFHVVAGAIHEGLSGAAHGLLFALAGFATGFSILLGLWLIGGGGAGDVKLMGALGAWLGFKTTLYVFFLSTCLIVIFGVATFAYQMISRGVYGAKKRFLSPVAAATGKNADEVVRAAKVRRRLMPYGVPVALATWMLLAVQFVYPTLR